MTTTTTTGRRRRCIECGATANAILADRPLCLEHATTPGEAEPHPLFRLRKRVIEAADPGVLSRFLSAFEDRRDR